MTEEWRPVVGYEGLYEVSCNGRIRSVGRVVPYRHRWGMITTKTLRGKIINAATDRDGYKLAGLWRENKQVMKKVHRLVADAFLVNRQNKPVVAHWDGNTSNNHVTNLRWATHEENKSDELRHGTRLFGERNPMFKHGLRCS